MKSFRRGFRVIASLLMLCILAFAGYNIAMKYIYPDDYIDLAKRYGEEYNVRWELVMAVINCESKFDPEAVSERDAVGLMQLTEETFSDMRKKVGDDESVTFEAYAKDPETNIKYGTRYLQFLLEYFEGDKIAAVAAYNAGLSNVKKWLREDGKLAIEEIEFPETATYVKKVLKAEQQYSD